MRKKLEYPPLGRPSVRSSVLTITFKENRMIKKKSIWWIMFDALLPEKSILPAHPWANMSGRLNKKRFYICSEVIDSITDANSRFLGGGLGWDRCGLRWFGGVLGLAWQVNVIKMFLNFFFSY